MRSIFRWAAALLAFGLLLAVALPVSAYDGYIYSSEGKWQKSVPLYQPTRRVELSAELTQPMTDAADLCYGPDGSLYVADRGTDRVIVYDDAYHPVREIAGFTGADGTEDSFNGVSGVFVDSENRLYVADTENSRVVVFSADGKLLRIVGAPEGTGIPAEFLYKPVAGVVRGGGGGPGGGGARGGGESGGVSLRGGGGDGGCRRPHLRGVAVLQYGHSELCPDRRI